MKQLRKWQMIFCGELIWRCEDETFRKGCICDRV